MQLGLIIKQSGLIMDTFFIIDVSTQAKQRKKFLKFEKLGHFGQKQTFNFTGCSLKVM